MSDKYILEGKQAIPCDDLLKWGKWYEKADRKVAKTSTVNGDVSTVFLGLDHRFGDDGPPLIFETLVFGGPMDQEMDRYSTWEEAEKGHQAMVEKLNSWL